MKNITLALLSAGVLMIIGATIRWSVVFYDMSQLVLASVIGVIFIGFAWIYERIVAIDKKLDNLTLMREQIKKEVVEYISS